MTDFLPVLSSGAHDDPSQGACVMEYVSLLAGEPWSDTPACTHPVLAEAAQVVNDWVSGSERHLLVPLIGRLFGTAEMGSEHERKVLSVRLAVWSARHVAESVRPEERGASVAAIAAADGWCDGLVTTGECYAATDAAYAAYAAYGTNYAANFVATSAANSATSAANSAASAANSAKDAATAADLAAYYSAAFASSASLIGFLTGLIDEYDRLTGRAEHRKVTADEYAHMRQTVGT